MSCGFTWPGRYLGLLSELCFAAAAGMPVVAAYPRKGEMNIVMIRILFVCVENSNRSQMAEAFARMYGGSNVEVYSAGSRPSGIVNPKAVAAMRELGYDLSRHSSKSLNEIPDVEYDFVATMGCGDTCPMLRAKRREDWNIPDPGDLSPEEFRHVRDLLERKVKQMLTHLPETV